jgi:predicted nucleic acid-binding protein
VIVIDASAILELLLNTPASGRVAERLFARNDTLHAPHLLDLEVAQVLRRYTLAGEMEAERSEQALEDLADLPLNRYPHDVFLFRIWALRRNLTAYDAAYIALAEALDAPLVTRDDALARAPGHPRPYRALTLARLPIADLLRLVAARSKNL